MNATQEAPPDRADEVRELIRAAPKASSGNFADPVGLVMRMLRSQNRAAYAALCREALKYGVAPIDWLLRRREQRCLEGASQSSLPVILIIGAPRSGTTMVYQALSKYLQVSYLNNFTSLFPSAPISASSLFNRFLPSGRDDFTSYYGQTSRLVDPNDGFGVWNRWLGTNRAEAPDSLDTSVSVEMQTFFDAWHAEHGIPFLNKNNRNTAAVRLLNEALRNVVFVVVHREPYFVAQSLIKARQSVQGGTDVGWGLMKQERHCRSAALGYVDDVCDQVINIRAELESQLAVVPDECCISIEYETFCGDPNRSLQRLVDSIGGLQVRPEVSRRQLPSLRVSRKLTVTPEERQRIECRLGSAGCVE